MEKNYRVFAMSATSSKKVPWDEVFAGWRQAEEEIWRPVYEGFDWETWDAWRTMMIADLNLSRRTWTEEILEDPHNAIPLFAIGGWNGWKKYRPAGKDIASFADIAMPPQPGERSYSGEPRCDVRTNEKVKPLIGCVHGATIIALQFPDTIAVLDGTHRCAAIAVEAQDGGVRSSGVFRVQLARFDYSENDVLKKFCTDRPRSKRV